MKKGQGALEYLMTYGWALLVIVVVGAALYALGVLNPSTYTQSRCTGLQYFLFGDQKASTTHYTVNMLNSNKDITVTGLAISLTAGGADLGTGAVTTTPAGTISQGSNFLVERDFTAGKIVGDSFTYSVAVTYNVVGGIQGNTDRGTCTGKIQ
ncbi:MAG: hypothetical protein NT120_04190 [Candidatus Aenigmarchaeota archaeon]|nr:hypothetical protein [Candidatus Aenigmarchaeota archaeon]